MSHQGTKEAYARCKACDTKFYPNWRDEIKPCGTRVTGFEELCWKCLRLATSMARVDSVIYGDNYSGDAYHPDRWEASSDETEAAFIDGFLQDKVGAPDSLWQEDPYLEYGERSMGDLGLFESYD